MSIVKTSLLVLGGTGLFAGSFVGFAVVSGHSLKEIPLLKNFSKDTVPPISTPPHPIATMDPEPDHTPDPTPVVPPKKTVVANASVLGAFVMQSPFSSDELADMQSKLTSRIAEVEKTATTARDKEKSLDERERALMGRETELKTLRDELDTRTKELVVREQELKRDSDAVVAQEQASWVDVAKFFQEGEPEDLAKKLATYDPKNAAKVLRQLDDERAIAIVNALAPEKYTVILDAYRKSSK